MSTVIHFYCCRVNSNTNLSNEQLPVVQLYIISRLKTFLYFFRLLLLTLHSYDCLATFHLELLQTILFVAV